jgi:hypothetical protein
MASSIENSAQRGGKYFSPLFQQCMHFAKHNHQQGDKISA